MSIPAATKARFTNKELMVRSSSWRAAVGFMARIAGPGAGLRITFAGLRLRLSALAGARSPGKTSKRQHDNAPRGCGILAGGLMGSSWRAAIGIMARIAGPGAGMRITIAGIRMRISALAGARRQGATLLAEPSGHVVPGEPGQQNTQRRPGGVSSSGESSPRRLL